MAELAVSLPYKSRLKDVSQFAVRATFPLWAVVFPIGAVGFILAFVFMSVGLLAKLAVGAPVATTYAGAILALLLLGCTCLAVTFLCLAANLALSRDCLLVDKDRVRLPLFLAPWRWQRRSILWSELGKVTLYPNDGRPWKEQRLHLFTTDGGVSAIPLKQMEPDAVEQLLLAVSMWGASCDEGGQLERLKQLLKEEATALAELSYTDMWEEELRRRFCPVAFLPLEPGRVIRNGSLKVVRQLAMGGLSAVYLCQLNDLSLVVAKESVLPEDSSESVVAKAREMFEREAQLLMRLKHPGIVQVFDYFVDNNRHYIMLEYASGQDLRQLVNQNGPQPQQTVVEWAIAIATILKHLHEQDPPIIHRDLTPDNLVLRTDGTIMLIDFGAANEFLGNATGTFVGKQSFIAPEQFRGKAVIQSDIYALGCTLHYLLTGDEPEALSTSSPKGVNPGISDELTEIVVCCTQMEPRDRYQSAAQLIPVLRKVSATLARV